MSGITSHVCFSSFRKAFGADGEQVLNELLESGEIKPPRHRVVISSADAMLVAAETLKRAAERLK